MKEKTTGKIRVMMSTEGTYPFHYGGVSTWADTIINGLNGEFDFVVYSIIMNPYVTQKFELPLNVELIKVPLWGTEEPTEHLDIPFSRTLISKMRTTDKIVEEYFIPVFLRFIKEITSKKKDSEELGGILLEMYKYFQVYEYKKSFKSKKTWEAYCNFIKELSLDEQNGMGQPGIYSLIQSLGWLYRFMTVLNTPIPDVHITHSAAAAFCGIPCVLAKLKNNTPFLLTEHGVYLREQYLNLARNGNTEFLSEFLVRMVQSVVQLNYHFADQVSPVCEYNTRWEKLLGVKPDKIKVIYNGVDHKVFQPKPKVVNVERPTVVSVARIDPVKDTKTFIEAAAIVKEIIPNVQFRLFGSVTVKDYYEECMKLVEDLKLGDTFVFEGHVDEPASAYQTGDIIVLSSISEGFPYSIVEAMMSGRAVVSTEVGGVKEALGECGILVPPRNPKELANGIVRLLNDTDMREKMVEEARERALNNFSLNKIQENYYKNYIQMVLNKDHKKVRGFRKIIDNYVPNNISLQLSLEKGISLIMSGYTNQGISMIIEAIEINPNLVALPPLLGILAEVYGETGESNKMKCEIDKAKAIDQILKSKISA